MSKLVVLNLGKGNLHDGFPFVTARLECQGNSMQFSGSLPSALDLLELYQRWQLLYDLLSKTRLLNLRRSSLIDEDDEDISIDLADITHVSDVEFSTLCQQLQKSLDRWLDFEDFRPLERQLRKQLHPHDEIRFIIQTEDLQVRKLPWHIWQFFRDYPQAEIALSSLNFEPSPQKQSNGNKVRILAILGDSSGINIEADRRLLEKLPDAEIVFLAEPTRRQLDEQLWHKQGWDILFFAGHSTSEISDQSLGQIYINKSESLTIAQLKNALQKAIDRGLQLAIFNSCDGLGLAGELADLHIPQTIVMREPVPDIVAQEFLKHFLAGFAGGQSFYLAVREARERLQGIENDFPGASWLPVICQNPAVIPATWQQLQNKLTDVTLTPSPSFLQPKFSTILITIIAVTLGIMALRWFGLLQMWELKVFDSFMQNFSTESADKRLLIVGADEGDLNQYGYPLPDTILVRVLDKLQQYRPAVIGLDIFRDRSVSANDRNSYLMLLDRLQKNQNIVAVCAGNNIENSIAPPSQISSKRIGFVDLFDDKQHTGERQDVIRRYLLSRTPNPIVTPSRCTTAYSFSWQLAYRYLQKQSISVTTAGKNWQFGNTIARRLKARSGGYQNLDARGNQLLIRYRNTDPLAQTITIRDILANNFQPEWIENRVVAIGIIAPSVPDIHDTSIGEIRGLLIHAHVISQILSAVKDRDRSFFWWLPQWSDTILVFFCSFVGGIIVWRWQKKLWQAIAFTISIVVLYSVYWFVFTKGGWLPFIPSLLALVFTPVVVSIHQWVIGNR